MSSDSANHSLPKTALRGGEENKRGGEQTSFREKYIAWFIKWMPESFVICLSLTILVALLAYFLTDTPLLSTDPERVSLVSAWADSFWNLLAFTMQMTVLLASGSAVASSPPAQKVLSSIAKIPKTRVQAIVLGSVVAGGLGFIHWGLGMMAAIVLGKEILAQARRRKMGIHPPVMVAALFMAFLPSSAGISGAAVLYAATPGYLKDLVPEEYKEQTPESLGMTETILRLDFFILLAVCLAVTIVYAILMHPKEDSQIEPIDDELLDEIEKGQEKVIVKRNTPAEKVNGSRWIMYFIGIVGFAYSVWSLISKGIAGLDLNSFNFLFVTLGMLLCAQHGPEYYASLIKKGIDGTWGFILQFPFYAGIFGLISATGLGMVITDFFTSISTENTWPVIAFLYSGLLNIAVPSGGSKFVIEAPYMVPTTLDLGADLGLVLQAYQMGDATTNLLIPFFALPYLANFKMKFSQVVSYTLPAVLTVIVISCIYFYVRAAFG